MPAAADYITGSISLTNGSVDFTGTSTGWLLAGFKEGDTIIDITGATEFMGVIATIDANGAGTLTKAWEGPTLVNVAYRMRYQPDGARVSAQARNLIELLGNGNMLALAGLSGSANQVPMFTGPGAMTLVPKTDLVSGANSDVQVDDLAGRAAYDSQVAGYAVLVANVGDGRAAIYSKLSATSGDWSDPAYVTGPIGPLPNVTVGTVTTGDPGTDVDVVATPTMTGVALDFTIPAGRGAVIKGNYNPATAYVLDDAVLYTGSTFIALQATTGNAPPTLPTTSNTWWQLLARQGTDGAGTGDVVGPASAVDGRLAAFDGTTGKLLKELAPFDARTSAEAFMDYQVNGLKPDKMSTNVLRLYPGVVFGSDGKLVARTTSNYDIDMAIAGVGGLDTGSPVNGYDYFVYVLRRNTDGAFGAVISHSITYGGVVLPAGYTHVRKLRFGFVYNSSWDGIPDHDAMNWPWPTVRLTGAEVSSTWRVLSNGAATSNTIVDCAPFIPDNARVATLMVRVVCGATAGAGYITSSGAGHVSGLEFEASANLRYTAYVPSIRADSLRRLLYRVTGSVTLSIFVLGYMMTEPS